MHRKHKKSQTEAVAVVVPDPEVFVAVVAEPLAEPKPSPEQPVSIDPELKASLQGLLEVAAWKDELRAWYPSDPTMAAVRAAGIAPEAMTPPSAEKKDEEPVPEDDATMVTLKALFTDLGRLAADPPEPTKPEK